MNILQILPELNVGGVETGTLDLAKYLMRLGHKAVVISSGGKLVRDLEELGVKHYQLPVHKKSLPAIFKMVFRVAEIIEKEQIDIVHARSRVPAWVAFFACRKTKRIFITTCHGHYKKHFFSRVMGWGKLVISPSNIIGRHMCDAFGVPHERIRLIPRGVDLDKFKFIGPDKRTSEVFHIGIIGRLSPVKGHIYFLKAMAKVVRVWPKIKIWIVGDAPTSKEAYKEEVRIMVRRLGLSNYTEFIGTQKDIPAVLSGFNLLAFASIVPESFGRVIIEAQASGVPVVATQVGGVVDIVDDGITGLLVAPADPDGMAEAVLKVIKDVKLASFLAQNAYEKVRENFSARLMAERTLDIYREALSNFKILVIKLSSLGDLVLSTAAIKAIREKFKANPGNGGPQYKISLLVSHYFKEIFVNCPYIDELIVYNAADKGIRAACRLVPGLIKKNFDMVIDLQNNRLSHGLGFLSLATGRYGYDNGKFGFLLNHRIKDDKTLISPIVHQFRILKMLGIEYQGERLELWPSMQDELYAEDFLKLNWISARHALVGINISASRRWQTKIWPENNILRLCEMLALKNIRTVLIGTERELSRAELLKERVKNIKPIIACGKTGIGQLISLIKRCQVLVSADSAPLHIACATGVAFVALFGPTDPSRHLAPDYKGIILDKKLSCSPCYKSRCKTRQCMNKISAEEVLEAIEKLLNI